MAIKNTLDLDQEIILLEQEELIKRNALLRNVITPATTLHTTGTLFMSWMRAGKSHSENEGYTGLLKIMAKLILPLTVVGTMLKKSSYIFKSIGFALSEVIPQLFDKHSDKSLWHFFRLFTGKENTD